MKAAARLLVRYQARTRETETLRSLRAPTAMAYPQDRYRAQQLPLSMAPYRLQAADRWWRENGSAGETSRKRPS